MPAATLPAHQPPAALPWQQAFYELETARLREQQLWDERYQLSTGLAASGLALGTPLSLLLVPWGSVLVSDDADRDFASRHEGRRGALMLTAGVMSLGIMVASIWHITRTRRKRAALDAELRAIGATRTGLERLLIQQLMTAPGAR